MVSEWLGKNPGGSPRILFSECKCCAIHKNSVVNRIKLIASTLKIHRFNHEKRGYIPDKRHFLAFWGLKVRFRSAIWVGKALQECCGLLPSDVQKRACAAISPSQCL